MNHRDIFISYVEEDGATVRAVAAELRTLGHSTWTYEEDGVAGISYLIQVNQAIENCRTFLLVASAKSVRSHQVVREVEQAHEREKVIIPLRVGLTHQQFINSHPILRVACGTAVTLALSTDNLSSTARRIASALTFGPTALVAERGGAVESVGKPISDVRGERLVTVDGTSPSGLIADTSVSPSRPSESSGIPPGGPALRPQSQLESGRKWASISIVLGLLVQVGWGALFPIGAMITGHSATERFPVGLVSLFALSLSGCVLTYLLLEWKHSSASFSTGRQLRVIRRILYVSWLTYLVAVVDMSILNETLPADETLFVFGPLTVGLLLVWNGVRIQVFATSVSSSN